MSPLFGKKKKEDDLTEQEDTWIVSQGIHNDSPMIARYDAKYKNFKNRKKYKYQVGVAIPLNNPNPGGLPDPEENRALSDIEDKIDNILCIDDNTLFVSVLTTGVMKEFVFYTSDPETIKIHFENLQNQISSHKIQLMIQIDEDWDAYEYFQPQ